MVAYLEYILQSGGCCQSVSQATAVQLAAWCKLNLHRFADTVQNLCAKLNLHHLYSATPSHKHSGISCVLTLTQPPAPSGSGGVAGHQQRRPLQLQAQRATSALGGTHPGLPRCCVIC